MVEGEHAGGDEREELAHDLAEDLWGELDQRADVQPDQLDRVPVHEVPVREGRIASGRAVHDDATGDPLRRGEAGGERGATDRLQDEIDTGPAGQLQHLARQIGSAGVEDVIGADPPHRVVFAR